PPRHPPRSRTRSSMSREAGFPASLAPGLAIAPAFGGDLDLVADLRGLLARDVPLALGFALLSTIICSSLLGVTEVPSGRPEWQGALTAVVSEYLLLAP